MSLELRTGENPRKWRFTWEAQSHIPTLRLFLFDSHTNPSTQCQNLKVRVSLSQSSVLVSWCQETHISLRVPIPRVLVDSESPVSFKALDDHIEVKLVLLLPVDHPIISSFDSILNLTDDVENASSDASSKRMSMDSDIKSLSSCGGVDFYCRSCSVKLTRSPLRNFVEMPSVNWREVADNWFGACCCSFGGISEKLVTRYVNSYTCAKGVCLLNSTTIALCKDDIVGCNFPDLGGCQSYEDEGDSIDDHEFGGSTLNSGSNHSRNEKSRFTQFKHEEFAANCEGKENNGDHLSHPSSESDFPVNLTLAQGCCMHHTSEALIESQKPSKNMEILDNKKSFLNGFLGNVFMVRSSNLSMDVEWIEFVCPQCSSLLGAYPCSNDRAPVDGGVRLFKCYISTSLPVGGSRDLFRNYTLGRMFSDQLLDNAKDELSFRTVVRDLKTKSLMLQIVLVNTNCWSCTGYCLGTEGISEPPSKIDLQPIIKVLFSECCNITKSQIRTIEDWVKKDLADEVFMLRHQIAELVESLVSAKDMLPPSYSSFEGLWLSSMQKTGFSL
ncbi:uncharacterized protein LOC107424576 isoform X1 [Ziziphus jujuba]|uniref:Uncharacterized protein LOC107424576 isoform X1 n=1 Tax=Ziziphus jujuba TaxID=326968 RepID=A0A6P4AUY5_ZIZJJ|nr:uncharacterized protein LOC107424576 isoform X1 [Ziziphus jujuba]